MPMDLVISLEITLGDAQFSLSDHLIALRGSGEEGILISGEFLFIGFLDTSQGEGIYFSSEPQGSPSLNFDEANPDHWSGRSIAGSLIGGTFSVSPPIPEPHAFSLLAAGLVALCLAARSIRDL